MLRQRAGSIISLSSVVGIGGNAGQANYAASKAGIIALTSSISKEVSSRNIRVNAIAPGFIVTEMTKQLPENVLQDITNTIPMKRGGAPEEVAKVALFLASDLASYVNGQVIHVCGGMSH
jgi:3-oxoacyl-[acyl-carrier protein] reductase